MAENTLQGRACESLEVVVAGDGCGWGRLLLARVWLCGDFFDVI